jgi:hypothetical protein
MRKQPRFPSRRTLARQPAPPGLYRSTYDPEVGAAICRRLAAGESLRAICRADAAMPTEKTVWNWARSHEDFRTMKDHALATARTRSLAAQAAQAARDGARWDEARPFGGRRGRTGRPSGYGPEIAQAILERVVVGEGLEAVCRDPAMPCVATVYGWMRRYPEFLAAYRLMKTGLEETMVELACERLPWLGDRRGWPTLRRTVRAAETAARRLSLKRLAPPTGPQTLRVHLEEPDGTRRVIYQGERGGE